MRVSGDVAVVGDENDRVSLAVQLFEDESVSNRVAFGWLAEHAGKYRR